MGTIEKVITAISGLLPVSVSRCLPTWCRTMAAVWGSQEKLVFWGDCAAGMGRLGYGVAEQCKAHP